MREGEKDFRMEGHLKTGTHQEQGDALFAALEKNFTPSELFTAETVLAKILPGSKKSSIESALLRLYRNEKIKITNKAGIRYYQLKS